METNTPNLAERFILLKGELRLRLDARVARHGIAGVVDVLIGVLLMGMLSAFARLAERRSRQQAIRDGADGEPERIEAAGRLAAGRRVAARDAVAAADSTLVCDDPTQEDCIQDKGPVRAACGRLGEGWPLVASLAAMGRAVSGLDYGRWVLEVPFAKNGAMGLGRIASVLFRYRNYVDCCCE